MHARREIPSRGKARLCQGFGKKLEARFPNGIEERGAVPKMAIRRHARDARPLAEFSQRERARSLFGNQLEAGLNQRLAQISVMIRAFTSRIGQKKFSHFYVDIVNMLGL